jgi:hypothetical protein
MKEEEVAMIRVEIREISLENRLKTSTSGEGLVDFETGFEFGGFGSLGRSMNHEEFSPTS